jgi:type II pantothenate kinase
MGITVGIDIGGSTTKIVGIDGGKIITPLMVKANDPVASLFGAFGKFIDENRFSISEIEKVSVTGVGASHVKNPIYKLPTYKVEEFLANGHGGLHLSGLDEAVIVSMGTGTAIIHADGDKVTHLGGTGVGGGTILGLSRLLLNIRDIEFLMENAKEGCLKNVDLTVSDISIDRVSDLSMDTTASNFGKVTDDVSRSDIALGIFNLVFQTIGMMSYFAMRSINSKNVVLIGKLSTLPQCRELFTMLTNMYYFKFVIPELSEFATAVGAALALNQNCGVRL